MAAKRSGGAATQQWHPGQRVVVVTGPEQVLVDRSAARFMEQIRNEHPDREIKRLHCGRKADSGIPIAEDIAQSASPSLFGEPPILQVEAVDQADEAIAEALKAAIDDPEAPPLLITHLGGQRGRGVINAAEKAGGLVVKCDKPSERDVRDLLRTEAKAAGGQISDRAEQWLIDALGTDSLSLLIGSVQQAVADSRDGRVDIDQVQHMLPVQTRSSAFQLADLVWAGDGAQTVRLLRLMEQRDRGLPVAVVAALAHGLRMMALAGMRGARPDPAIRPWMAKRARSNAQSWQATGARVARLAVRLPGIDADMKGSIAGGTALDDEQKMAVLEQELTRLANLENPPNH
ncbi:MAG: hypothetical protein K0U60_06085 [Actinomycetia bacterium]|nr:hypothetical protein [Actinomycetes bacterium]MCH9801853.1 hypothetical protein [Actinomycetes bacterium]